jgi:hypothetical protein
MSRRIVISSLAGAVTVAAGATAFVTSARAAAPVNPAVSKAAAHFAPAGPGGASLTFTATVRAKSGVKNLKVLAWPASSHLAPTAREMTRVESATCRAASRTTVTCAYGDRSSAEEAAALPKGTWYVSVLATAKDHRTTFVPKAARFAVKH